MTWGWGQKTKSKPIHHQRPKWNNEKNHRIPRAFSARAQWGHSNAAVERRIEKYEGFAATFDAVFRLLGKLFSRKADNFRPDPPSKRYQVEVK